MKTKKNNRSDEWALVTGGSSGIGLALSERLASLGYNLVIVSIDASLERVGERISSEYGVRVVTRSVDLARPDAAAELHEWCGANGIAPSILINNAGIFIYNDIINTSPERIATIINLHVLTTSMLSRLFAADMVGRGRGRILNLSSYSAWMPYPGLALYSATKIFIRNFSRSLSAELRGRGVTVTMVMPAGVTTGLYGLPENLQKLGRRLGILFSTERIAEKSLRAMFRGRKQYIPGFLMHLVLPFVKAMPDWLIRFARRKTLSYQK